MQLAVGRGAGGHVGVLLVLDTGPGFDDAVAERALRERACAVPRLRQRLYQAPPGCGRPYWADDPEFDVRAHVRRVCCPPPGDERTLLDVAAAELVRPLPRSRPLWSAAFVSGLADGGTGLVIVVNHVLADGIAGLAVLAALLDPGSVAATTPAITAAATRTITAAATPTITAAATPTIAATDNSKMRAFPAGAPSVRTLAADAWARRARRLAPPPGGLRRLRQGIAELGGARLHRLPSSSLNRPTGARRQLHVVTADLAAVRRLAHAHGGTVNDVALAVVASGLADLLATRGEQLHEVAVSVPVSARPETGTVELGNQIGVMPVIVPADGDIGGRVRRIAAITRERKSLVRGASAALFVPGFLLLARTGLLGWFDNHQRFVHTFVTNLRGPSEPPTLAGVPVRAVIAIPATTGNVTVTFGVLSCAGTLRITVLYDPDLVPDALVLADALRRALDAAGLAREGTLVRPAGTGSAVPPRGNPG